MSIRREDLVAAASHGLLQHSQVDPLLIFLLQREILAKRAELAAGARAAATPRNWLRVMLAWTAAFLAVLTAGLFALLHVSRWVPDTETIVLFGAVMLYTAAGVKLVNWSRMRGYCRAARVTLGVLMASVPLAALAVHQVVLF